jgi:hypothetical protein
MNNYYRNKKLRDSAKHESCVSCGANDGTVVWAHSNSSRHGKGAGLKAHDLFGAYLCQECHRSFDESNIYICVGERGNYSKMNPHEWFKSMWEKSMIIACEKGYI